MIPQLAGRLLDSYAGNAHMLFDPYCGTGTSLVEGLIRGIDGLGTDLNPLARLIATAKTSPIAAEAVEFQINRFDKLVSRSGTLSILKVPQIPGISRLDFWFKPGVIQELLRIKRFIEVIEDEPVRLFFMVAFSETVRESSNSRSGEFKLYRYAHERLRRFNPEVFGIMSAKLTRNLAGLKQFLDALRDLSRVPHADIADFNTVQGIPANWLAPGSVDIVVTSPPYGDSHTTVAYGQYSRLSAAWLGLGQPEKIDRQLMGESPYKTMSDLPCEELNRAVDRIAEGAEKRAREVSAFYQDLYASIRNVAEVIRPRGYACYVVGNRKVKGVVLPTDKAVRSFFEISGFDHVGTFHRSIPNKRMPRLNSPSNVRGAADETMVREHILVMRRRGRPIS
jgi:site-specific DNA-methyltransferase (cytosine-N4-specific)